MSDSFSNERPAHHVHSSEQPLPGVGGQPPAVDYSAAAIEREPAPAGGWDHTHDRAVRARSAEARTRHPEEAAHLHAHSHAHAPGEHALAPYGTHGEHALAPGERPAGAQEASEGGIAVEGHDDLHAGKPKMMDKLVGKTEKVIGKLTKNTNMQEKGELREVGGKNGAAGAPHD